MSKDTKIKDVKIIRSGFTENFEEEKKYFIQVGTEGCIPKNRDAIALYADEPCVEACQLLYDLNIETYTSSGHAGDEKAIIGICYDSLSEQNKKIANYYISKGIIDDIVDNRGRGNGLTISLEIPIHNDLLVGDVSDKLIKLASLFQQQDVLYGRYTIDEIKSSLFSKLEDGNYRIYGFEVSEEKMQQLLPEFVELECKKMYTSDGITYFISEDLLNKHLNYMENFEIHKNK